MNKITWLFILLVTSQSALANDSCKVEGYVIGFFNGVATTRIDAERGRNEIHSTLNIDEYKSEKVEYKLFYNDSYIDGSGFNVLADLAETFDQRTQELEQKQFDRWEAFWDIVNGRQDSSIIQKISAAFSWFDGFVNDFKSQTLNVIIREFLEALTLLVDAPETEKTQMVHNLINDSNTWKGKKLIYIAHSQGNLWVNKSYNYVVSQLGYDANNIHVVHIAPASPTLSPDSDYILSTSDLVINGLNFTGIGSVPPPNTVVAPSLSDITGHGLVEIYLTHPDLIEKIKASVNRAFSSLTKPEMENILFKIDYDYSANFKAWHPIPQYAFVDSKESGGYGGDYLDYNGDIFSLAPSHTVNPLLFNLDNEEDIINIESCRGTNELQSKEQIPDVGSFLFADFSNIKELNSSLDMTVSKTVTDRYGKVWEKIKIDVSPSYSNGYSTCDGNGSLIELVATQNHYTAEQKKLLKRLRLSGRYRLETKYKELICMVH